MVFSDGERVIRMRFDHLVQAIDDAIRKNDVALALETATVWLGPSCRLETDSGEYHTYCFADQGGKVELHYRRKMNVATTSVPGDHELDLTLSQDDNTVDYRSWRLTAGQSS